MRKLQVPAAIPQVQTVALWVALAVLILKESLLRYMLAVAERVRSSLLVANAWHARADAASSRVVAIGIGGNLLGFALLDPIAAVLVGLLVAKTGWGLLWNALHDLMDRARHRPMQVRRISAEILATPGVLGLHELKTRKTGVMLLVDVHREIDGALQVVAGHAIALQARRNVMVRHPGLNVMTHVDPIETVDRAH